MLTLEEWSALSEDDKITRAAEKPEEDPGKGSEPTVAEMKTQLESVNKRITEMEDSHKREVGGIVYDLKNERRLRQELEEKLRKTKTDGDDDDPLKDKADDDIVTVGELKKMRQQDVKASERTRIEALKEKASDRMDRDEERMIGLTKTPSDEFPVPYDKALKSFEKIVADDKGVLDELNREALRPGGRPAQFMYRVAMTKDPELTKELKKTEREKIIAELDKEGKIKRVPGGGGAGKGEVDLSTMSDEDILKLASEDPKALDKAAGKPS